MNLLFPLITLMSPLQEVGDHYKTQTQNLILLKLHEDAMK